MEGGASLKRRFLENMTLGDVEADIVEASFRINSLIPEQKIFSLSRYICANS
jgi:hypothetical protein